MKLQKDEHEEYSDPIHLIDDLVFIDDHQRKSPGHTIETQVQIGPKDKHGNTRYHLFIKIWKK